MDYSSLYRIKIVERQLFIVDFLVLVNKKLNDSQNIYFSEEVYFLSFVSFIFVFFYTDDPYLVGLREC